MSSTDTQFPVRIQLYLSRYGEWSRRKAADVVSAGRVTLNGVVVLESFRRVEEGDRVEVDGKPVLPLLQTETWVLNKPAGVICTSYDPEGRQLAVDLIPGSKMKRLYNVGRLDYYSCGLILITNDGELADRVMHPSHEVEKEYLVKTTSTVDHLLLKKFQKGFSIKGINYKIRSYQIVDPYTVKLCLNEGKNREIRRFFEYHKIGIKLLRRIRIGSLELGSLKSGEARRLERKDLDLIFR